MRFNYQARTKTGEIQTGVIEASSTEAAISLLAKHGLHVTLLEPAEVKPIYARKIKIFERISQKDLVLFSRQLSILFRSKVPLVESLQTLGSQTKNSDFRDKIWELADEVKGGSPFSAALAQHPKIFSTFYIAMVKAGEVAGKLSESLEYLADHLEREYHLASKTIGALIYPCLVLFVVSMVLVILTLFVIPSLSEVLLGTGLPLPLATQIVINISAFLRNWALVLFLLILALIFGLFRYYQTKRGKNFFDKFFLRLPIIGPFLKMVNLTRFAENLSTLISGGLPISQALETVSQIIGNSSYQEVIFKTRDEVRKGVPISAVLAAAPDIFPPIFTQMVLIGERTGTLDTSLMNLVNFYKKEIDRTIDNILSLLGPFLIIILGVVVAGLILAILVPLYQMIAF